MGDGGEAMTYRSRIEGCQLRLCGLARRLEWVG